MSAPTATVVNLAEYRRRRGEGGAAATAPPPFIWYPVWFMVPVWPMHEPSVNARALVSGW
jgi:hypothetical protein